MIFFKKCKIETNFSYPKIENSISRQPKLTPHVNAPKV